MNNEIVENSAPKWMKYLPFVLGGGYFVYSYFYAKKSIGNSFAIAGLIFLGGTLPWLSYNGKVEAVKNAEPAKEAASPGMNKTVRQNYISYIADKDEAKAKIEAKGNPQMPTKEQRLQALNKLTNQELKTLYAVYKFEENKELIANKYGTQQSNETVQKAAFNEFGIDLSDVNDASATASQAMTKIVQFLTPGV